MALRRQPPDGRNREPDGRDVPFDHRCCWVVELMSNVPRTQEFCGPCQYLSTLLPGHGGVSPPERASVGMQSLLSWCQRGSKTHRFS